MSIRDELADAIAHAFIAGEGKDFEDSALEVADTILGRYGVVELREPDEKFAATVDEHSHERWDTELVSVTAWETGDFKVNDSYGRADDEQQLRIAASVLLAAVNRVRGNLR